MSYINRSWWWWWWWWSKKYVLMFSHMQNLPNLLLLGYCMCLTVLHVSLHVSMHVSSVPTWFACLVNHSMEVPLACLRRGGAGHDFKSSQFIFRKNVWQFWLELKLLYVWPWLNKDICLFGLPIIHPIALHLSSDCGNGEDQHSACAWIHCSHGRWCICHASVGSRIGNLLVLKWDVMSSKSSLFEFERCANLVYCNLIILAKFTAIFTWHI